MSAWFAVYNRPVIFSTSEVAEIVGGTVHGPVCTVEGASIDSRSVAEGALFVPIVAERDGHDFIDAAMANGAAAHLTSVPLTSAPPVEGSIRSAVIVGDTADASVRLGLDADLLARAVAAFETVARGGPGAGPIGRLPPSERFHFLTATRSTALQTLPVRTGLTDDPAAALARVAASSEVLAASGTPGRAASV